MAGNAVRRWLMTGHHPGQCPHGRTATAGGQNCRILLHGDLLTVLCYAGQLVAAALPQEGPF